MSTISQNKLLSSTTSAELDTLSESLDLSQTPLEKLMDEAFAGGDQIRDGAQPTNNDFDDAVNFSSPGPIPSLLRQPLLNNPFKPPKLDGAQPTAIQSSQQTESGKHTAKNGDTLSAVAAANNMSMAELIALNPQIKNADNIHQGDRITASARQPGVESNASTHPDKRG